MIPEAFSLIFKAVHRQYLKAGELLFGPDLDFPHTAVLISGTVRVSFSQEPNPSPPTSPYITSPAEIPSPPPLPPTEHLLHELTPGRVVTSLFTIIHELVAYPTGQLVPNYAIKRRFTRPPHLVARAATDAFLAVVPAGTFASLVKTHPEAADQVLALLSSRVTKVTLPFVRRYLGHSPDLLRIVQAVDVIAPQEEDLKKWRQALERPVEDDPLATSSSSNSTANGDQATTQDGDSTSTRAVQEELDDTVPLHNGVGVEEPHSRPYRPTPAPVPKLSLLAHLTSSTAPLPTPADLALREISLSLLCSSLEIPATALPHDALSQMAVHHLSPGALLVDEGKAIEGVCVVLKGTVEACKSSVTRDPEGEHVFWHAGPGAVVGAFSACMLYASPVVWRAGAEGVWFCFFPNSAYLGVTDKVGGILRGRMRRFLESTVGGALAAVDLATEWRRYPAGSTLTTQSQPADFVFKIVSGRIRATVRDEDDPDEPDNDQVVTDRLDEATPHPSADHIQAADLPLASAISISVPDLAATRGVGRAPEMTARSG
ncbi:hypothetical protein HDU93_009374, partial [Gonapodya sp. JEL0774]